jgi:hypothetical protein
MMTYKWHKTNLLEFLNERGQVENISGTLVDWSSGIEWNVGFIF